MTTPVEEEHRIISGSNQDIENGGPFHSAYNIMQDDDSKTNVNEKKEEIRRPRWLIVIGIILLLLLVFSIILLIVGLIIFSAGNDNDNSPSTLIVNTAYGPVQGNTTGKSNYYLGIPYAAPPINERRLASPYPPVPWTDIRPAVHYGNACRQTTNSGNEDCLFINVFQPSDIKSDERLPVMVWIYGGGFTGGDSSSYPGNNLAAVHRNVIVSFNYRLGALGFMTLHTLQVSDHWNITGMYGMADQVMALQWVQDNIEAFGGNKSQVTIAGESAGAISVCFHLVSPLSRGLFQAAIMESGICDSPYYMRSMSENINQTLIDSSSMGCPQNDSIALVQCLRALPAGMFTSTSAAPTIDGTLLTDVPVPLINNGSWANVPTILGTNRDEGTMWLVTLCNRIPNLHNPLIEADLPLIFAYLFRNNSDFIKTVSSHYPVNGYSSIFNLTENVIGDYLFKCPTRRTSRAIYVSGMGSKSYLYHFTYLGQFDQNSSLLVSHAYELRYVFDLLPANYQQDQVVSNNMQSYWSNLIKHGDPSQGEPVPIVWPFWSESKPLNLEINQPVMVNNDLLKDVCDMWDELPRDVMVQIK